MNRRLIIYSVLSLCLLFVGISATPSRDIQDNLSESLFPNLEFVEHIYPNEDYLDVIDSASNVIIDSTGSLKPFYDKLIGLRSGEDEVVSIIHLGDSHIQGGFWDSRLKELFQSDFGDAGPGLIVPHKLAGGNEPGWYAIITKEKYVSGRVTSRDLAEKLGFTGVAVGMSAVNPTIKIWSKEPFNSITVFHHPKAPLFREPDSLSIGSYCTLGNSSRSTRIALSQSVDSIALQATITQRFNNPTVYGFSLENGEPGILLHSVGVNSAAFEHFERNTDFTQGGARDLAPDLIIVSLGTNNCYGSNYKSDQLRETAESFVRDLISNYPGVPLLITTPMEGCRRIYGRYSVNKNVADVSEVLRSVAKDNGVACWDLYNAAGGNNASNVWYGRRLMQGDHLHMTEEGYALQGDMLYNAIMDSYNGYLRVLRGEDNDMQLENYTECLADTTVNRDDYHNIESFTE